MADAITIVAGLGGVVLGQALGYLNARSRLKGEARFDAYKGVLDLTRALNQRPLGLTRDDLAARMVDIERRLTIAYGQGSNITARWRDLSECQDILRDPRYATTDHPSRPGVVKVYNDIVTAVETTSRSSCLGRGWHHVLAQGRLGWPAHRELHGSYRAGLTNEPGKLARGQGARLK